MKFPVSVEHIGVCKKEFFCSTEIQSEEVKSTLKLITLLAFL